MRSSGENPRVRAMRELLGLAPRFNEEDLKRAYHRLALLYHPDRNAHPTASEEFQKVSAAFKVLGDPVLVRSLNQTHLREKLYNNVIEGLNISFGSFFGYRVYGGKKSRVERARRLGNENPGESDVEVFAREDSERDHSILENAAYDALEVVYAGKFSVGDDQRLKSGMSATQVAQLPWVLLNNQGILYFLDGELERALACYAELNDRVPGNIIFMYRLGLCHVLLGFKNSSRDWLMRLKPNRLEVRKGITLFEAAIRLGENRSIGKQRCLLVRKFLADVYFKIGQSRRAAKVWRQIAKLEPRSLEARAHVRRLPKAPVKRLRART